MPRYPSDTDPETEAKQIELLRSLSEAERFAKTCALTDTLRALSRRAIKRANPGLSQRELDLKFVAVHYGEELATRLGKYLREHSS